MADSNDNSSNTNIEITEDTKIENTDEFNDESIKQNPPPKAKPKKDYQSKHYHNLTSGARRRILDEYDRGIENPNYEVIICTNGKRQLRKRKTPLQSTHNPSPQQQSLQPSQQPSPQPPSPQQHVSWIDSIQYYNVQNTFNEQVLKQIEDLQSRISHQNDKHKKLKSKYRKLKRSLYEDEEEAEDPINNQNDNSASEPSTQPSTQQQYQPEDLQQQYQTPPPPQKRNMRDAVDFSRYGFRMY